MISIVLIASALSFQSSAPKLASMEEFAGWRVSEDGRYVARGAVSNLYRVADWSNLGPETLMFAGDPEGKRTFIVTLNQLLKLQHTQPGITTDKSPFDFAMLDEQRWAVFHDGGYARGTRTGQFLGFVSRLNSELEGNQVVPFEMRLKPSVHFAKVAFSNASTVFVTVANPQRASRGTPSWTLESWQVDKAGKSKRRFNRKFQGEIAGYDYSRAAAMGVNGFVQIEASDARRLVYHDCLSGENSLMMIPKGHSASRLLLTPSDVFVFSASSRTTLRFNLQKDKWSSIPRQEIIAASGSGKFALLAGLPSRRLSVKRF